MPFPNPDTRFPPGRSGNPGGRPKGRSLRALLREALDRDAGDDTGRSVGEALTDVLLKLARDGDRKAIRDVFDQAEGRPVQAVELSGPDGVPFQTVFYMPENGRDDRSAGGGGDRVDPDAPAAAGPADAVPGDAG